MADHKLFIVNVLLLVALVAGATYLQKTYDTDKAPSGKVVATETTQPTVASTDDTGGWHITTAAAVTAAPAVSAPAPKPATTRVYNRGGEDDDN